MRYLTSVWAWRLRPYWLRHIIRPVVIREYLQVGFYLVTVLGFTWYLDFTSH